MGSSIIKFVTEGALFGGVRNYVWLAALAIGAAIIFTIITIADNAVEDTLDTAKDAGKAEAVAEGHETTLEQTGAANEAGNEVRDNRGNARYNECVRSVAQSHRAYCERYRQDEHLPD